MATIKSEYYRFNGAGWDMHYFKTSADLIVETTSYKVMTAAERTAISTYIDTFNAAEKLVKINAASHATEPGKIPSSLIPPLGYLPIGGGTLTGPLAGTTLSMSGQAVIGGTLYVNGGIASDNTTITFSGLDAIDFDTAVLKNVGAPTVGTDAANKEYVDNLVAEGVKPIPPVKCATAQNITLSGLVTIDGYQLLADDRVLVKNQTTPSQNGIYVAKTGAWVKVTQSVKGYLVFVENGDTYNDWKFYCENAVLMDVPTYNWIAYSKVDTISAGTGLLKAGTTIRIKNITEDGVGGITSEMIDDGAILISKISRYAADDYIDVTGWTVGLIDESDASIYQHTRNLYAAIALLRGTQSWQMNNTQTIAGAYEFANTKNKTFANTAAPVADANTYRTGDLYFKELSRSA